MPSVAPLNNPHANQPITKAGVPLESATKVLILIHGRGATAHGMLGLLPELNANDFAVLAPQAANNTWYPNSFLAPMNTNQPDLDSALNRIESIVAELIAGGIASDHIALLGFSQGACLATEFAARHPRRYGAILAFSGGLIGPPGTPRTYKGSLDKTPVFLGSGDPDPHVPFQRVEETRDVLQRMNTNVDMRRYPGMPHTINEDELEAGRNILSQLH
jgi:predicted esterase